jgi:hypothetical protein
MARIRRYWQIGLAAVVLSCPACMAPGAPAPAAAGAAPAAAAGPAPFVSADPDLAPPTGLIGKMCAAIDDCRRKLCKAPCGQLINGMTLPLSGLTGGVIPPFCPILPSAKDLMKPGVEGEAAAIKKDAAEAKARRQAVRLLGTVDCRYYADAADKLIAALRTDGVECVRLEAAWALGSGCCCQPKVIDALDITVAGLETDGNPAERSPRVRDAAAAALEHCLACAPPAPPSDVLPPPEGTDGERPKNKKTPVVELGMEPEKKIPPAEVAAEPTKNSSRIPRRELLERARATLAIYHAQHPNGMTPPQPTEKSLVSLFKGAETAMVAEPKVGKPLPDIGQALPIATPMPATMPILPPLPEPPFRSPVMNPIHTESKEPKDLKPAASLILPQD